MIVHNIGTVRKLIEKRKEIIQLVKNYINADSVIVASLKDKEVSITGHTPNTETTILLAGRVIAVGWESAQEQFPGIRLKEYLTQPTSVALAAVTKQQEQQTNGL